MNSLEYREFGKTGRKVSRIGFGGAPAGLKNYLDKNWDPSGLTEREQIIAAARRAVELGITYFDTAPGYGDGESERILGEALEGIDNPDLFVATKVGSWKDKPVRESLEKSLHNLRRDSVDLLQIHGTVYWPHQIEWITCKGGFLDQMETLREEGLIRHIGFTNEVENRQLYDLLDTRRFDVMQCNYNLVFQHPYAARWKAGSLFSAKELEMGTVSMRSLTSGIFQKWLKQVRPDDDFNYAPALLQFQLSNPLLDVVLVGMRNAEEVEANLKIAADASGRVDLEMLHDSFQ